MGATPGLSPTMAVALLAPFTFLMTPPNRPDSSRGGQHGYGGRRSNFCNFDQHPWRSRQNRHLAGRPPHGPSGTLPESSLFLFYFLSRRRSLRDAVDDTLHTAPRIHSFEVWAVRDVLDRHLRNHRHGRAVISHKPKCSRRRVSPHPLEPRAAQKTAGILSAPMQRSASPPTEDG